MKIFFLSFFCLCCFINTNIFSQNSSEFLRPYDVLKYEIFVDLVPIFYSTKEQPDLRKFDGKVTITLTPRENNLAIIELDAVELLIQKISINDQFVNPIPENSDGLLLIPISPIMIGDTIDITI